MRAEINIASRLLGDRILGGLIGPLGSDGRREISLERFGIAVAEAECRERIEGVLAAFFTGLEIAVKRPSRLDAEAAEFATVYWPFYYEGAAMGFGVRCRLHLRSVRHLVRRFEADAIPLGDPFLFLRYIGLGFWLGFQLAGRSDRLDAAADRLSERRYRHLVHDGYGFQYGFFAMEKEPARLESLRRLPGFGRASAFNGLGRSLWFFYMDRPEDGFVKARSFGEDALDLFGGMGLAAGFTRPDRLEYAYSVADGLDGDERRHFEKGIRIALYCRHANHAEFLAAVGSCG